MKRKHAAVLLIVFLIFSVLIEIESDLHVSGMISAIQQVSEHQTGKEIPTISEMPPVDHQVSVMKPKSLAGSVFFGTSLKRNNALFIKNIIGKVLLAFFTAFYSGIGKNVAIILMICMAFTGMLMARIRILHQTDGKKRHVFCLEIPQKA